MNKPNPLCSLHLPAGMVPECLGLTSPEGRLPAPPAQIPADRACSPLPFGRSAPAWRQRKSALPSSPPAASAQRHANSALGRGAGTCRTASSRALDARPRQGMLAPPAQGLHEARPQAHEAGNGQRPIPPRPCVHERPRSKGRPRSKRHPRPFGRARAQAAPLGPS